MKRGNWNLSKFEEKIHKADFGEIAEVIDPKPKSKLKTKMMYVAGQTPNGYCYKDYNTFQNDPDGVCYIAECGFGDDVLFVDYVNENKEKLIASGVISTRNSIKDEIREVLKHDEYYYKYEYNGIVHAIHSRDFEDGIIDNIAKTVFEEIDWQTSQAYTSEIDWCEDINEYYKKRLKSILNSFMGNKSERCEELLCACISYIDENIESYTEMLDTFRKLGFSEEELDYFEIRDYNLEMDLEEQEYEQ